MLHQMLSCLFPMQRNNVEAARLLAEVPGVHAALAARDQLHGITPLGIAVALGYVDMVGLLLDVLARCAAACCMP